MNENASVDGENGENDGKVDAKISKSQARLNTRTAARLYKLGYIPLVADGLVSGGVAGRDIAHFEQEGDSVRIVVLREGGAPYYLSTDEGLLTFLSRYERYVRVGEETMRARLDALDSVVRNEVNTSADMETICKIDAEFDTE